MVNNKEDALDKIKLHQPTRNKGALKLLRKRDFCYAGALSNRVPFALLFHIAHVVVAELAVIGQNGLLAMSFDRLFYGLERARLGMRDLGNGTSDSSLNALTS
jgi:hypothetical protein